MASESTLLKVQKFSEGLIPTKNKMGIMIESLEVYDKLFIDYVNNSPKDMKVADLGVAYGYTTKALLKTGAIVTANDLSNEHLQVLWNSVTEEERSRLQLTPGNVLDLDFPENSFDGILACRWIHFLNDEEIGKVLALFYKWLVPSGKVTITCESVYSGGFDKVFSRYEELKQKGDQWPGYAKREELTFGLQNDLPDTMYFFDTDVPLPTRRRQHGKSTIKGPPPTWAVPSIKSLDYHFL